MMKRRMDIQLAKSEKKADTKMVEPANASGGESSSAGSSSQNDEERETEQRPE